MTKRLYLLVIALLACGLLAAGCGDDDDDDGGGDDSPAQTQTQEEDTGADTGGDATAEEDAGGGAGDDVDAAIQQAVDACKQSVQQTPTLSDDVKSDLEDICDQAATGDVEAVQKASRDVCVKIAEESIPEGAARDQAVDACEQAVTTP